MIINFNKYQGTGNDFVIIDDRNLQFPLEDSQRIARLCHRRFGVGADGLILLQNALDYDFRMVYFNSDGAESTMCGNGGRCIVAFAYHLGIFTDSCRFIAIDGPHEGKVLADGIVSIKMSDVSIIEVHGKDYVLNTGSPHYVREVEDLTGFDVYTEGKNIRYSEAFPEGINVNFVKMNSDILHVSTYERGVEDETYSCGTGVVASTIAMNQNKHEVEQDIETKGGKLNVRFTKRNDVFSDIWLTGPATSIFEGVIG